MVTNFFTHDVRLKIKLPTFSKEWSTYSSSEQEIILLEWEEIRGSIPDRIKRIEDKIELLQGNLGSEENFERSCAINDQISEYASQINDLWIWYRTNPNKTSS